MAKSPTQPDESAHSADLQGLASEAARVAEEALQASQKVSEMLLDAVAAQQEAQAAAQQRLTESVSTLLGAEAETAPAPVAKPAPAKKK